jgi:DNA-binding MarR family transcriptional regulator
MSFDLPLQLDKIFHERARLGIMSVLMTAEEVSFAELISTLNLTRGNLSVHLKILEESRFITSRKEFINKKPRTTFSITPKGTSAFNAYLNLLEKIIIDIKK